MNRRKNSGKQLDPPAAFRTPRPTGPDGLIPPSHFQSRSAPPPSVPWSTTSLPNWEAAELRRENQLLKDELQRWTAKGEKTEEMGNRTRSLDREAEPASLRHTLAMSQQAEIISHQLHEIQRLEAELAALHVTSAQQAAMVASRENSLAHLQGELADLGRRSQAEAAALKAELEEVRRSSKLETEAVREKLEELKRQSCLEVDFLREELESTKERHGREIELAREELQDVLKEREADRKRQEERAEEHLQSVLKEHQAEVQLQDPLQSESSQKFQCLLTRWREKVFSLLVQLKSQELSHMELINLLQRKGKEQEDELECREQKVALLLHNLEDKTAEVNMEKVKNKTLQAEVLRLKELAQNLQQKVEAGKNALQGLGGFVNRLHQQLVGQEETWKAALSRLIGLGNRIAFAAKRVDTIQGLVCQKVALAKLQQEEKSTPAILDQEGIHPPYENLQAELEMLHEERDWLSMELKRGAQLIEKKVAEVKESAESELKEMREIIQSLQEVLESKTVMEQALRQQQEAMEKQLETAQGDLQRSEETVQSLRQELGQLREEYEKAMQEKVTEVETKLHRDLSKMEKSLSEAQREHTKAVVALRQTERQAARDKAHCEELAKLQESAMQQETARLEGRLRELERDKNLLMATLRQEGLLSQYRQNRLAAIQAPVESSEKADTKPPSKESLLSVLDDLQVLSAAILGEEEEEKPDKDGGTSVDT
ncbi:coiled-coil alpha-helical rod protein 1 isoform X3 [Tiliqua scincoides]|uniref:coiled-coil alpha-helical rod protein 1 isoform X3 n=1 Tax=Tiliqua scincoides TaxID=71010 RepID=UPI003461F8C3